MIDAAYRVLGEIVNILAAYADDMRIIGGWVPSLLFQGNDHIGSIDVDGAVKKVTKKKATEEEKLLWFFFKNKDRYLLSKARKYIVNIL